MGEMSRNIIVSGGNLDEMRKYIHNLIDISNTTLPIAFVSQTRLNSHNRYEEFLKLTSEASEVGLITEMEQINPKAKVLVYTQEMFFDMLPSDERRIVIFDEFFHVLYPDYGYSSKLRTPVFNTKIRKYIDYMRNSNDIFIISVVIGNPEKLKEYLERVTGKPFELHKTDIREPNYTKEVFKFNNIPKKSLVYYFDHSKVRDFINRLLVNIPEHPIDIRRKIKKLSIEYNVSLQEMPEIFHGIALFYSGITYRRKKFIQRLISEGWINTIFCTDTISEPEKLMDFEYVFFKNYDRPIKVEPDEYKKFEIYKIEFYILSQKARKVALLKDSEVYSLIYRRFISSPLEKISENIKIIPYINSKAIIQEKKEEDEAGEIAELSEPKLGDIVSDVFAFDILVKAEKLKERLKKVNEKELSFLRRFYIPELSFEENEAFMKCILGANKKKMYIDGIGEIYCFLPNSMCLRFKEKTYLNYLLRKKKIMQRTHFQEFDGKYIYWQDIDKVEDMINEIEDKYQPTDQQEVKTC